MTNMNLNIEDINEADVIELFAHYDIIVSKTEIDKDENSVKAYIEITSTNTYTIGWIEEILKRLRAIQDELIKEGLIEDMSLGDIYKGVLMVSINLKTATEAEHI
jgi:hypothetical protein